MKKTKNVFLAIAGGLMVLTVATVSCSKSSSSGTSTPPVVPTITSVSPASDTIGQVITITGTGLSGATVKIGGIAATIGSTTATSVSTTVPAGVALGTVGVIATTTGGSSTAFNITIVTPPPPGPITVDGKTNSTQVETASLVAYWPFRTNSTDTVSSIAASITGGTVTYTGTDGPFGAYANFSNAGYLVYPPIPNLDQANSLDESSVSMWVKIQNNNSALYPATGGEYTSLFGIESDQLGGVYGPYQLTLHTNQSNATDVFTFGATIRQIDGRTILYNGSTGTDHLDDSLNATTTITGAGNGSKWIHVVQVFYGYTPNPRPMFTYVNGVLIDQHLYYNLINAGENIDTKPGAGDVQVTFGTFHFADDFGPNSPWGGAGGTPYAGSAAPYWAHGITGGISDVRFFKIPLDSTDVSDLYQLGMHGQ